MDHAASKALGFEARIEFPRTGGGRVQLEAIGGRSSIARVEMTLVPGTCPWPPLGVVLKFSTEIRQPGLAFLPLAPFSVAAISGILMPGRSQRRKLVWSTPLHSGRLSVMSTSGLKTWTPPRRMLRSCAEQTGLDHSPATSPRHRPSVALNEIEPDCIVAAAASDLLLDSGNTGPQSCQHSYFRLD